MELVTSIDDCVGKDLLAWIGYSPSGRETACFPRPQFRMDGGSLSRIDRRSSQTSAESLRC